MGSLWRVMDTRAVQSTATETTPPYEIMYSWSPDSITLVIEYGVCRQTRPYPKIVVIPSEWWEKESGQWPRPWPAQDELVLVPPPCPSRQL